MAARWRGLAWTGESRAPVASACMGGRGKKCTARRRRRAVCIATRSKSAGVESEDEERKVSSAEKKNAFGTMTLGRINVREVNMWQAGMSHVRQQRHVSATVLRFLDSVCGTRCDAVSAVNLRERHRAKFVYDSFLASKTA